MAYTTDRGQSSLIVGGSALLAASLGLILLFAAQSSLDQEKADLDELRSGEPNEWEHARLKIQYYMHENLAQEKWIFRLSSATIGIGFILIVAGIVLAFQSALTGGQFLPSVVATLSGVIVQFIGRSFLWVYKSTTEQAAHYVGILERIYAVHMSQLLIEPNL